MKKVCSRQLEAKLSGATGGSCAVGHGPNMSGVAVVDQARMMHLAELALDFARQWLQAGRGFPDQNCSRAPDSTSTYGTCAPISTRQHPQTQGFAGAFRRGLHAAGHGPAFQERQVKMNDMAKNLLLWLIIAVVLLTVFQSFNPRGAGPADMSFRDFMQHVAEQGKWPRQWCVRTTAHRRGQDERRQHGQDADPAQRGHHRRPAQEREEPARGACRQRASR